MNIMQALHDLQLNPFGAVLLAESFLKSPLAERAARKCEPLAFNLPVDRADCAAWAGVRFTLTPVKAGEDAPALDAKDTEITQLQDLIASADRAMARQEAEIALAGALVAALTTERDALSKDAGRYQLLRRGQQWSVIDGIGEALRAEHLDAAIDAAMLKEPK